MEECTNKSAHLRNFFDKNEKSEERLGEKQKQSLFLNGILDRDYDGIKNQRDKLYLSATILKLRKKK